MEFKVVKKTAEELLTYCAEGAENNLSNLCNTLQNGADPQPRTPLHKEVSPIDVLEVWFKLMKQAIDIEIMAPSLGEYEYTRLSKFGPQGGYPPFKERMESFKDYFTKATGPRGDISHDELALVVDHTCNYLFGSMKETQRHQSHRRVIKESKLKDSLDSNSGLPLIAKRSNVDVQEATLQFLEDKYDEVWELPCILFSRAQRMSDRFIFMFPMVLNIIEQSYINVIIDVIKSRGVKAFAAWSGFEQVCKDMALEGIDDCLQFLALDYTKMDKHCNEFCAWFVYLVTSRIFQKNEHAELKRSIFHLHEIGILIEPRKIVTGFHGMPSGSGWTNCYESIVSLGVIILTLHRLGYDTYRLDLFEGIIQLLGDDAVLGFYDPNPLANKVFCECAHVFGLEANPEKISESSENVKYLQRFFDKSMTYNYGDLETVAGCYPGVLALNTSINPERQHEPSKWSGEMEIIRWIMILENMNQHPLFYYMIELFIRGDGDQLGLKIPGFIHNGLALREQKAKQIKGLVASYTQEKRDKGLEKYDTIHYLRYRDILRPQLDKKMLDIIETLPQQIRKQDVSD